jgi:flagellum-specific ATP synthase
MKPSENRVHDRAGSLPDWEKYLRAVKDCRPMRQEGKVIKAAGLVLEASGPGLCVGSLCAVHTPEGHTVPVEIVGFKQGRVVAMPFGEVKGIKPGSRMVDLNRKSFAEVGKGFLGRVIDGLGCPLDAKGPVLSKVEYPIHGSPLNPLRRGIIHDVLDVGVRSINALATIGKGQRMAIMSGSGVGKSVLMGMIARNTAAAVSVIALIGERGREVREFLEGSLGKSGLQKSVVVVATADASPLVKIRATYLATAMAEYFRDQGLDVILMMDSVTRFAMALREVGLAAGEPPSSKGYTPSVFSEIPKLLERAGYLEAGGSITGIYNVLVEGDDMNEPISDSVRSVADGHIVLSRTLAHKGHFPAVDAMASISRVMKEIVTPEHREWAAKMIKTLAVYREAEDLINIGAYADGSDPEIDFAKKMIGKMNAFLQQGMDEKETFDESLRALKILFEG